MPATGVLEYDEGAEGMPGGEGKTEGLGAVELQSDTAVAFVSEEEARERGNATMGWKQAGINSRLW
jgi:hypothetical protein